MVSAMESAFSKSVYWKSLSSRRGRLNQNSDAASSSLMRGDDVSPCVASSSAYSD
jgi:hypothetical protein